MAQANPTNAFQVAIAKFFGNGVTADDFNSQGVAIRGPTMNNNKWNKFIANLKDNKLSKVKPSAAEWVARKRDAYYKQSGGSGKTWKVFHFDKSCSADNLDDRSKSDALKVKKEIDKLSTSSGIDVALKKVHGLEIITKCVFKKSTQPNRVGREIKPAGGGSNHGRIFLGYNTDTWMVFMTCIDSHFSGNYGTKAKFAMDKTKAHMVDYGDYEEFNARVQSGYNSYYEPLYPQQYLSANQFNATEIDYLLMIPILVICLLCCCMIWFICCGVGGSIVYVMTRKSKRDAKNDGRDALFPSDVEASNNHV